MRAAALMRMIQSRRNDALPVLAVTVGVDVGLEDLLLRLAVAEVLLTPVALRLARAPCGASCGAWTDRLTRGILPPCPLAAEQPPDLAHVRRCDRVVAAEARASAWRSSSRGCGSSSRGGAGACPSPVTLNRFFAAELVFCLGISCSTCCATGVTFLCGASTMTMFRPSRTGCDSIVAEILHVLGEAHEQVVPPLRMRWSRGPGT